MSKKRPLSRFETNVGIALAMHEEWLITEKGMSHKAAVADINKTIFKGKRLYRSRPGDARRIIEITKELEPETLTPSRRVSESYRR